MINLMVRGFAGGGLVFWEKIEIPEELLDQALPAIARKHITAMVSHRPHMIEIEFLDEPDPNERFFRFGTDATGMVHPIRVDLGGKAND